MNWSKKFTYSKIQRYREEPKIIKYFLEDGLLKMGKQSNKLFLGKYFWWGASPVRPISKNIYFSTQVYERAKI